MAMRAVKHGPDQRGLPPPLGAAPPRQRKAEVLRFPDVKLKVPMTGLAEGILASMPARDLSDLEFVCEYKILTAKPVALKVATSGNGSGGNNEWRPRWNKNYGGGIALWNLLANAELMTPVGRKFIPNPRYNGDGLSPPQKDPLAAHFDNVVDLAEVRAKAMSKMRHSARSRGYVYEVIEGPPEPLDVVPVQQTSVSTVAQAANNDAYVDSLSAEQTKDWGKLDLSAFGWGEVNDDMLSGNTDEEVQDTLASKHERMMENTAYFIHHVGTQLSIDGAYQLSPSCDVEPFGEDEVILSYQLSSGYKAVRRMKEEEFMYRLDDGGIPFNAYLWKDEAPYGLMDEVAWEMFGLALVHDWDTHEGFETWSNGDLAKLNHWHNHSHWVMGVEIEAVFNGVNQPVSQSELWIWEGEAYRNELDKISKLRNDHKVYLQSTARYKVFGAPKAQIKRGFPGAKQLNEDNRYKKYWLEQYVYDEEFRYEYRLAAGRPVLVRPDAVVPNFSIGHPSLVKKVKVKAVRAWNKMVDVLNTPVTQLFKSKPKAPKIEPTLPNKAEVDKIDAIAEGMAVRMIYLGNLHDDQYDLEWLEKLSGHKLDPNRKLPDPVELAIKAVNLDVPVDEFSKEGIYLGKSVQLPRTESGLILPTHMPNSRQGSIPDAA